MKSWKEMRKRKKSIISIVVLLVFLIPVLIIIFAPDTIRDVPIGLEIEESIDLSYNEWQVGIQYVYTGVWDDGDGIIRVSDSNINQMAQATRIFNSIDIGRIKMQMREPTASQNSFAMEFRYGNTVLFKLIRNVDIMLFSVLSDIPIILTDLEGEWQTFEIFFDLSDGNEGKISIDIDGVNMIDDYLFNPNGKHIDNIYIHTEAMIYKSRTDIKFEYLYNFIEI